MDIKYAQEYEQSWLRMFKGGPNENVGYVTSAYITSVVDTHVNAVWFPNQSDRYHQVTVHIPRNKILFAVDCWQYGEDPHLFIDSAWLEDLYLRTYSVFGFVDAVDIGEALATGVLNRAHFIELREALDALSTSYPDISFISFGDSILLKSNWNTGYIHTKQKYSYYPEIFLSLIRDLQHLYRQILGVGIYTILTQGSNEFYESTLIHIAESRRHICLNSLGIPFAQIFDIDRAVRIAIRTNIHERAEVYMEESFFMSLNRKYDFGKPQAQAFEYKHKLLPDSGVYYPFTLKTLLDNIYMTMR